VSVAVNYVEWSLHQKREELNDRGLAATRVADEKNRLVVCNTPADEVKEATKRAR